MTWPAGGGRGGSARWESESAKRPRPAGRSGNSAGSDDIYTLEFRDAENRHQIMRVRLLDDEPTPDRDYRIRRLVDVRENTEYLQKRLSLGRSRGTGPAASAEALQRLDNEIQIGLHLARSFGQDLYPRELSQLCGFYLDDSEEEPFVLLRERGAPSELVAGRLLLEAEEHFPISLLRALELMAAVGVVHRALTPQTVYWDDRHVQVVDFRHAALVGEPAGSPPDRDWSAPEAESRTEAADPTQDAYAAGLVLVKIMTGDDPTKDPVSGAERLRPIAGGQLVQLLREDPAERPDVRRLLEQLDPARTGPPSLARPPSVVTDARFADAARRFEDIRERHRDVLARDARSNDRTEPDIAGRRQDARGRVRPPRIRPDDTRTTEQIPLRADGTYGGRDQ